MRTFCLLLAFLLVALPAGAQEATPEPNPTRYLFTFPLPAPDAAQIDAAYACFGADTPGTDADEVCALATSLVDQAATRQQSPPTDDEIQSFAQLIEANPVLALHLPLLAGFFGQVDLVAPPESVMQPIIGVQLHYTFMGLGGTSPDYTVTITDANTTPRVSGQIELNAMRLETPDPSATEEASPLPETLDPAVVQALAPALRDLVPIAAQFSTSPCWDYYPDWTVTLTFADETTLDMVTNGSNAVGAGGPWQVEIDGQNYVQYSYAFGRAVLDLFEALNLSLGETMAMGCGGMDDPMTAAYPQ